MSTTNYDGMFTIRDFKEDDRKFILATFLKGLYYGDSWFSTIPQGVFMDNYKKVAMGLIDNPNNFVKVACLKDDEDVILGYSILGHNFSAIHWVFVKAAWRKGGIAKALVPAYPTATTHLTGVGRVLMSKFPNLIFNPFII